MNHIVILLFLLIMNGCASGPGKGYRYVWPPPPDDTRIEYIGTYASQLDFPLRSRPLSRITGTDKPLLFSAPVGIASDGKGKVYIADARAASVIVYDLNKFKIDAIGEPGLFHGPSAVTVDSNGKIYAADNKQNIVFVFDPQGNPLMDIGNGILNAPSGIAVNNELNRMYIVSNKGHRIDVFDLSGKHLFKFGEKGNGKGMFNFPVGIAINTRNEVIVTDSMNALIQIFDSDGNFLNQFGKRGDGLMDFQILKGIAVDSFDQIYVTDSKSHKLLIFSRNGDPLTYFTGRFYLPKGFKGKIPPELVLPTGLAIDKNNTIFLCDTWKRRFNVYQYMDEAYLKKNPLSR